MTEYFDVSSLSFYRMSEEELRAERRLRVAELRQLRWAIWRLAFRVYAFAAILLFVVLGAFGVWAPVQAMKDWPPYLVVAIVTAWWLFLLWLVLKSGLSDKLDGMYAELEDGRATYRMCRRSIRMIDKRLWEAKKQSRAKGGSLISAEFNVVSGDDWDLYLITRSPGADQWLLEIRGEDGSSRIERAVADTWLSRHRRRDADETAWLLGSSYPRFRAEVRVLTPGREEICRLTINGRKVEKVEGLRK